MSEKRCFKVVVVGDAAVGKSCLLYRLKFGRMPEGGYTNTIGCEFVSYPIETKDGLAVLCIWDTAGHETFRSFMPSFIRGAHACLVCADLSNTASNIKCWVGEAQRVPGASIVLVGTKADMYHTCSEEYDRLLTPFMSVSVLYRETSALTGNGVDSLFGDVATHLLAKHATCVEGFSHPRLNISNACESCSSCRCC